MLIIRFQRQGRKKDFVFRIVAVDSKIAVNSGKATEILGWFNPKTNQFELKKERILYWLNQGAQVSDSCYNFLIKAKVIEGQKRPIKIRKKKEKPSAASASAEASVDKKAMEGKEEEPIEEKKPEPETKEEKKEVLVEKQKEESKKEAEEKSDFKKPEK